MSCRPVKKQTSRPVIGPDRCDSKGYTLKGTEDHIDGLEHHLAVATRHSLLSTCRYSTVAEYKNRIARKICCANVFPKNESTVKWQKSGLSRSVAILHNYEEVDPFHLSGMKDVLFKTYLIASSLVTHSIRGVLTSVCILLSALFP